VRHRLLLRCLGREVLPENRARGQTR
jgi:hypothetical protein